MFEEEHPQPDIKKLRMRNTISITWYEDHRSHLEPGDFAKKREADMRARPSRMHHIIEALDSLRKTKNGSYTVTCVPVKVIRKE